MLSEGPFRHYLEVHLTPGTTHQHKHSPAAKLYQNQGRRMFYFHAYQSYSQKKKNKYILLSAPFFIPDWMFSEELFFNSHICILCKSLKDKLQDQKCKQ